MNLIIFAGVVCAGLIVVLEALAPTLGLTDKPSARKRHIGEIPLIGGIAMFGTIAIMGVFFNPSHFPSVLVIIGSILVLLGMVDDIHNLSARFRLLVQVVVVSALFFLGDMRIETIGNLFFGAEVHLNQWASYGFTVICAIGVINAINMIDGLDGLAGSILLVSFMALGAVAVANDSPHAPFIFMLTSCLVAFLAFNNRLFRRKARIFMGDAGSMFLGLVLVWYFVKLTQSPDPSLTPISAGWIFGLPLIETVSVMIGRIVEKRSPFDAGRDHMHHRLRSAGFTVNMAVGTMLVAHTLLVTVGVAFSRSEAMGPYLFWGFVALTIIHFLVNRRFLRPIAKKAAMTITRRGSSQGESHHKKNRHNNAFKF